MRDGVSACTSAWDLRPGALRAWRRAAGPLFEPKLPRWPGVGLRDRVGKVCCGRMVHFRLAPFQLNSFVRVAPGTEVRGGLCPMNESRLIAPLEQFPHCWPVGAGKHEGLHLSLAGPTRCGPEHVAAIPQQFCRQIAIGSLCLPGDSHRSKRKNREVVPRSNAKTGNGYD